MLYMTELNIDSIPEYSPILSRAHKDFPSLECARESFPKRYHSLLESFGKFTRREILKGINKALANPNSNAKHLQGRRLFDICPDTLNVKIFGMAILMDEQEHEGVWEIRLPSNQMVVVFSLICMFIIDNKNNMQHLVYLL